MLKSDGWPLKSDGARDDCSDLEGWLLVAVLLLLVMVGLATLLVRRTGGAKDEATPEDRFPGPSSSISGRLRALGCIPQSRESPSSSSGRLEALNDPGRTPPLLSGSGPRNVLEAGRTTLLSSASGRLGFGHGLSPLSGPGRPFSSSPQSRTRCFGYDVLGEALRRDACSSFFSCRHRPPPTTP